VSSPLGDLGERFALEWIKDLDAPAAYLRIRPGVTRAAARTLACRLLTKVDVQARIRALKAEQAKRLKIEADRVLQELAVTAFSDVGDYRVGESGRLELAPGAHPLASRALASVKYRTTTTGQGDQVRVVREVEYRLWDKVGSLKALGEHLKLFKSEEGPGGCEIILGEGEEVRLIVRGRK
jgi:phage terminase small subunit